MGYDSPRLCGRSSPSSIALARPVLIRDKGIHTGEFDILGQTIWGPFLMLSAANAGSDLGNESAAVWL